MKTAMCFLAVGALGLAAGYSLASHRFHARHAAELARLQASWQAEREQLQAALDQAQARDQAATAPGVAIPAPPAQASQPAAGSPGAAATASVSTDLGPADIIQRLGALRIGPGQDGVQAQREAVRLLDELVRRGPAALPAIRDYLARGEDVALTQGKAKGKGPPGARDSLVPASLRAGLISAAREIGGPEAEQVLAETLANSTRPDELLRLTEMLEKMAPGKYRDTAVAAAQARLNAEAAPGQGQRDSGPLYEVLTLCGDTSYTEQARRQLFNAEGRLNKEALDYLQAALGPQNLPVLQQVLQEAPEPKAREEAVKQLTGLAGTDPLANQLWCSAALDAGLPAKAREKALAELDKRGFQNRDQPTDYDRQLAQTRLQLLDHLRPQLQDPNQLAALDQARARLAGILDPSLRLAGQGQPKAPKPPKVK